MPIVDRGPWSQQSDAEGVRRRRSACYIWLGWIVDVHSYICLNASGPNLHLCLNTGTWRSLLALVGVIVPDSSFFFSPHATNSIARALAV